MIRMGTWAVLGMGVLIVWPAAPAMGKAPKRLRPAAIRVVMNRHLPLVKDCGRVHRVTGRVRMRVKIVGATGRVRSVHIGGALAGNPVASCVRRIVLRARFPRFRSPTQTFVMPVSLHGGKKLPKRLAWSDVTKAMKRVLPAIARCAKKHRIRGSAKTRAKMTIVGRTGKVSKAKLIGRFSPTPVGRCVVRALNKARFRRFKVPYQIVVWTILLR